MKDRELTELLTGLSGCLAEKAWKMTAAESCTGGWIAKCCTDLAGSSAWFERGFVTYSNKAKMEMLGVDEGALSAHGAVSRVVAEQMAGGARRAAAVETSLSVTGIAGPDGGSKDKPVGTVWFAWSLKDRGVVSEMRQFEGDRNAVRWQTVVHALQGLYSRLQEG